MHGDGIGFAELAHAVALHEERGVAPDHDDREAGDAPVLYGLRDIGIETGERLLLREDQQQWENVHGDKSSPQKKKCATFSSTFQ